MKKNYVISKTPLRVTFLGGGTDIPYFYKNYGGATINLAINKYVYVTVKRHSSYFIENYRLNYHETENCFKINQIKNSIIKETIKYLKIRCPLFISIISDVPTGTGLGGSSSFTVGLVLALAKLENIKVDQKKLFNVATEIELNIIKNPIGKQDHVPAVFGGMNYTNYLKNDKIQISKMNANKLNENLMIVWTKITRDANFILENQKRSFKKNIKTLKKMKDITTQFYKSYYRNKKLNLDALISDVNFSWQLKEKLSRHISLSTVKKLISDAQSKNIGAKILGAGGGGFVFLFDKKLFKKIEFKNYSFIFEKVNVSKEGSKIIFEE